MRIISGKAKGRLLNFPKDKNIRPVTDKVKEAIFSILGDKVKNSSVLDLYAGSGSLGIEALSRGARKVVFVDYNKECIRIIKKNLLINNFLNRAALRKEKVEDFLKKSRLKNFDIIFIDPPWSKVNWQIFNFLIKYLKSQSLIVLRLHKKIKMKDLSHFAEIKRRCYGDHQVIFLKENKA